MDRTQQIKADLERYRASKQTATIPQTGERNIQADLEAYRSSKNQMPSEVPTEQPNTSFLEKAGNTLNDIFGGKKIGEAIGTQIAKATVPEEQKQYITGPTAKEVLGDVGRVALNFAPVGKIAGTLKTGAQALKLGKLAKPISTIGTGTGIGYAGDVTTSLAQGKEKPFEADVGTGVGTAIGSVPVIGKALGKVTGLASEIALGTKGKQAVQTTIKNAKGVQEFGKGRTLEDVANKTSKAVQKFGEDSKRAFNTAIDLARDDVKFTPKKGVSEVSNVIKENPLYLEPQEKMLVSKAKNLVSKWKNWTPKGIIKLRQEIDRRGFYKDDETHRASDKIINSIRKKLNEMAISLDDTIAPALEKASFDIEQAQKLGYNLVGNNKINVEATANKLKSLLAKIDDPVEKEATKNLLDFLKERTGVDIGSDLQALSAYLEFQKPLNNSSILGIAQSLGKKIVQPGAIGLGKTSEALKKIPIPKNERTPGDYLVNMYKESKVSNDLKRMLKK